LKLDEIDIAILRLFQSDCRIGLKEIGEKIGKSPSFVKYRLTKLMDSGVIKKCVALLDESKLGYIYDAIIMVRIEPGKLEKFEEFIMSKEEILYAYAVTGEYDVCIIAIFKDEPHYLRFVEELHNSECVKETTTFVIVKKIKEDPKVPI